MKIKLIINTTVGPTLRPVESSAKYLGPAGWTALFGTVPVPDAMLGAATPSLAANLACKLSLTDVLPRAVGLTEEELETAFDFINPGDTPLSMPPLIFVL
eukprot:TRINITY_DN3338_c0_g1_i2.p2 TRINITY_DN3338_c0_g1~~TRINITY_DN3338_c0_g1_i2.p2  ORF type:complete len:100 (-),score=17.51 TRINITY_DN3338_c0_g1_i2:216-515(-)